MASFMGPETPRPFACISESYQRDLEVIKGEFPDMYSFGEVYEKALCSHIHRYGEINIDDRIAYVGPSKGSIADCIKKRFSLIHDVTHITPGTTFFERTENDRNIPVKTISVGAENYFTSLSLECQSNKPCFDRVIVRDTLEFIEERRLFYGSIMGTIEPNGGKMVIIHRPAPMLSLPYYNEAKMRALENDIPYMEIITDLQELGYDVQWEIEILPIVIPRTKWLSLLYHRYPNQLEVTSSSDIYGGLRELTEGQLKYTDGMVEFFDRLLIISVSHTQDSLPDCKRFGGSNMNFVATPLHYKLEVTPEIAGMVEIPPEDKRYRGRPEWWGTVHKDRWVGVDSARIPSKRMNHLLKND